jgi:hypothetical protein
MKASAGSHADNVACVPSSTGLNPSVDETSKADHSVRVLVLALTSIVFMLDVMTPLGTATWALYALPLSLSRWSVARSLTFIIAGICTILMTLVHVVGPPGPSSGVDGLNRVFGVLMLWIVALFLKADLDGSSGFIRSEWSKLLPYIAALRTRRDANMLRNGTDALRQKCFGMLSSGVTFLEQELSLRMPSVSIDGILYSARGLSFGWETRDFLYWTSEWEEKRPGAREEIIAEAHHLAAWPNRFAELAFLVGTLYANLFLQNALLSIIVGLTCLLTAFHLEVIRFYSQGPAGTSRALSYLSMIWGLLTWPAFLIAAATLYPHGKIISIAFIIFLIVQGRFKLITAALSPLRVAATNWIVNSIHGPGKNITCTTEAMSLAWVIERWRQ